MNGSHEILVGDVREQLQTLPENLFHCCVTSPPYWALRDYKVDGQIGSEGTIAEFLEVMADVFRGVKRVLRPDGVLWLNIGDTYSTGKASRWVGVEVYRCVAQGIPDARKPIWLEVGAVSRENRKSLQRGESTPVKRRWCCAQPERELVR